MQIDRAVSDCSGCDAVRSSRVATFSATRALLAAGVLVALGAAPADASASAHRIRRRARRRARGQDVSDPGERRRADRQGQRHDRHALAGEGLRLFAGVSASEHGAQVVRQGQPASSARSTTRASRPTACTSRTAGARRAASIGSRCERTATTSSPISTSCIRKTRTRRNGRPRSSPCESVMSCEQIVSIGAISSRSPRSPPRRCRRRRRAATARSAPRQVAARRGHDDQDRELPGLATVGTLVDIGDRAGRVRTGASTFLALSKICTHEGCDTDVTQQPLRVSVPRLGLFRRRLGGARTDDRRERGRLQIIRGRIRRGDGHADGRRSRQSRVSRIRLITVSRTARRFVGCAAC